MGLLLGELDVDASNAPIHTEESTRGAPSVTWNKGCPIKISPQAECYSLLTTQEIKLCETIRMMPKQYLHVKSVMLGNRAKHGFFKKLDAKKWFKIDVNKTGKIYDWFSALGWIIGEDDMNLQ
ncbi:Transcriptional adapter ada2 [Gonapodya sp. JEL0774]|nr:Transcriptional adapter ada2 [Gonapodya sp. JEL0774]